MNRDRVKLVGIVALFVSGVACESAVTGNEGNFIFSYPADDRVFDFNKPIAVGAFLDMEVKDAGDRSDIELSAAATSDTSVLTVESFTGSSVTVRAVGEGNTELKVDGKTRAGESQSDAVNLLARVPEVHKLLHTCGQTEGEAAYLTNQQVYIGYEFEMSDGQPVIGYGYYPVTPSTAAAALDESFQGNQFMRFDLSAPGSVTLSSDLTDASLVLRVVEESALDGVEEPTAFVGGDLKVGNSSLFYVLPTTQEMPVCQAITSLTVHSDTPAICAVTRTDSIAGDQTSGGKEHGWFKIDGLAAGHCLYTVTFSGGTGATGQFGYEIVP